MRQIISISFILILSVFVACDSRSPKQVVAKSGTLAVSKEEQYKRLIDSLGLQNLYDKTKWALYCLHCDSVVRFKSESNISDTLTYASLDLRIDTMMITGDSTEIDFRFYYKNIPCDLDIVSNVPWSGVWYVRTDSVKCYSSLDERVRYYCPGDPDSRYLNLSHPDVIKYINANKEKLHPWFLHEAERRGLIKETPSSP